MTAVSRASLLRKGTLLLAHDDANEIASHCTRFIEATIAIRGHSLLLRRCRQGDEAGTVKETLKLIQIVSTKILDEFDSNCCNRQSARHGRSRLPGGGTPRRLWPFGS